jgi:hypothetical protein
VSTGIDELVKIFEGVKGRSGTSHANTIAADRMISLLKAQKGQHMQRSLF